MKSTFLIFVAIRCLMVTPTATAQNVSTRSIVLDQIVKFSTGLPRDQADFRTVSVIFGDRLLKQFATPRGDFLQVVATFNGYDGDYLLLRTSMGQGACAGGDLHALRFYTLGEQRHDEVGVQISPVLTTCLGEWPPVKFYYDSKGELIISVSGYSLKGQVWKRWTPEPKVKTSRQSRPKRIPSR